MIGMVLLFVRFTTDLEDLALPVVGAAEVRLAKAAARARAAIGMCARRREDGYTLATSPELLRKMNR